MGRQNVQKTQNSVFELTKKEMANITAEEWSGAVRLATQQEELYLEIDYPSNNEQSDEQVEVEMVETNESIGPKTVVLKCEHCEFESDLPHVFKNHKKSITNCTECSKIFCGRHAQRDLKRHQKKHSKIQKVYTCEHCRKSFDFNCLLKRHLIWSKCGRQ